MARFGHSAVLRNGTMLIHAGFQVGYALNLLNRIVNRFCAQG